MVIGTAQNGYVREALKLVREMRESLADIVEDETSLIIGTEQLKKIEELLTEAVKYGRDLFQEAG